MNNFDRNSSAQDVSTSVNASQGAFLTHATALFERVILNEDLKQRIVSKRMEGAEHQTIAAMIMEDCDLPEVARTAAEWVSLKICAEHLTEGTRRSIRRDAWSRSLDKGRTTETTSAGGKAKAEKYGWSEEDDALLTELALAHTHESGARIGKPDYRKIEASFNQQAAMKRTYQSIQARGRMLMLKLLNSEHPQE